MLNYTQLLNSVLISYFLPYRTQSRCFNIINIIMCDYAFITAVIFYLILQEDKLMYAKVDVFIGKEHRYMSEMNMEDKYV